MLYVAMRRMSQGGGDHPMRSWSTHLIQRALQRRAQPSALMWGRRGRLASLICGVLMVAALTSACSSKVLTTAKTPTATPGDIQLTTDLSSYSVSQAIGVTVTNGSSGTTYYTRDGRSNCSIVQLDQYVGGKTPWVAVDLCTSINPPQVLQLSGGLQEPFSLSPTSKNDPNAWDAGEYRVELSYTTQQDGVTHASVAYSAGFTIHT